MKYILSQHAQEELVRRKIPIQIFEMILDFPEDVVDEDGLKVYQGSFTAANNKTYLVRAYVNDLVNPQKVVTVYFTSKTKKYRSSDNES